MYWYFYFLIFWDVFVCRVGGLFSAGSFYGDSFTFEQITDISSSTTVSLLFQTKLPNGVLLVAVGQSDHLVISIKEGRLEVLIHAGAKEGVVRTASGVEYNNQLWHQLDVFRIDSKVNILVNGLDVITENVWTSHGHNHYLNIDLGVFIGGYDNTVIGSRIDDSLPFFRGCILTAEYNNIDVLHPLQNIENHKIVYNVDAGCARIFQAHETKALHFTSIHGYLKYHRWTSSSRGVFECRVKTLQSHGLILFNDAWKRHAFVGLEMVGGKIRCSINRGSGIVALQSTHTVNDGKWHRVRFSFSSSLMEIRVDKNRTKLFFEHDRGIDDAGYDRDFKLRGPLFIGGIDYKLQQNRNSLASGLQLDAFPGCLKNIRVDFRAKSFDDILSSHDASIGCNFNQQNWTRLPTPRTPFIPTFVIIPQTPSPSPNIFNTSGSNSSTIEANQDADEIVEDVCYRLHCYNITLDEGGARNLTTDVISLIPTRPILSPPPVSMGFTVSIVEPPRNGRLLLDGLNVTPDESFSWQLITQHRLSYVHDGSDSTLDHFTLSISSDGNNTSAVEQISSHLLCDDHMRYLVAEEVTCYIHVTSVDDPPLLRIPANYIFHPVRFSRTPLPREVFKATDPDSPTSSVFYHLLGLSTGLYIENTLAPGRPVSSFTQQDVDLRKVNFVHAGGPRNARLLLQVSNEEGKVDISRSSIVLRISSISLRINVTNNTGLTLVEGESLSITTPQLASETNAGNSLVDITYQVQTPPTHGQLQVSTDERDDTLAWVTASSFQQTQLTNRKVRYLSTDVGYNDATTVRDGFGFVVKGAEVEVGPYFFNITILQVQVHLETTPIILRNGTDHILLSPRFIALKYSGVAGIDQSQVQLVISKSFSFARLSYKDNDLPLTVGDIFTLSDVIDGRLRIEMSPGSQLAQLTDYTSLTAVVRNRYRSHPANLTLTYIPDLKSIKVTVSTLQVDEGKEAMISRNHIHARTLQHERFLFQVLKPAKHGTLRLRHGSSSKNNVTSFTTGDISEGKLYYMHDDSENDSDHFMFRVIPIVEGELPEKRKQLANISSHGRLNISITLLNDNAPVRIVNKPLHVVRRGQRLLTRHDLWYEDPDVDQDDLDLKYVRRGITNGDILNATSGKKIYEFTQRDMTSQQVMFRHKKSDFGRFVFFVRDGRNYATGLFVVIASDPYLKIVNSSALQVEKGEVAMVTNNNIQADTNVVALLSAITYRVSRGPTYGRLFLNQNETNWFTQQHVNDGLLHYRNGASPHMRDNFTYMLEAGEMSTVGTFQIRMFLASMQQPPSMRRNRPIVVLQSHASTIRRSHLRATHPDVRPRDVIFTIRTAPSYGHFSLNRTSSISGVATESFVIENATTFSQWDVNHGHLSYVETSNMTFDLPVPLDNFTFDVSNGILSLTNVEGSVEIVPLLIPLRSSNFSVSEGRSRVLIPQYLDVPNPRFHDLDIDIYVIDQPTNGMLARDPGKRLDKFSLRLLRAELLSYNHDGSDTLQDSFQLQARTTDGSQRSDVVTTHVTILSENDQVPQMRNNTGLLVWVNSITPLSPHQLAAVDLDTPPEDLTYQILPPRNGHIALKFSSSRAISNFTQEDVNDGNVVFVHRGSNTGGFTFQVDDGRHYDSKHYFAITARLLVITVLKNTTVQVFPSTLQRLSSDELQATTNDEGARDLYYYVTTAPQYGAMMMKVAEGNETRYSVIERFNQSQVDAGLVFYNQSEELNSWSTTDRLRVTVSSYPAEDVDDVWLTLNVSYDAFRLAERSSCAKVNRVANIREGGSFNLTLAHLDASNILLKLKPSRRRRYDLRYRITSPPLHGKLHVGERTLSLDHSFLHRFLQLGIVNYTHDDSEEEQDFFRFEAFLQHKARSKEHFPFTIADRFNITVRGVNDEKPVLETKSPRLEVIQGQEGVINSSLLRATDLDNSANEIRYRVIRAPSYGTIALTSSDARVTDFTQRQVNHNVIVYRQHQAGSSFKYPSGNTTTTDAFYFSLTDGKHNPIYSVFIIKIHPIVVDVHTIPIMLVQGDVSTRLSSHHITVSCNGDVNLIVFNLTNSPIAGNLYIDDNSVTAFMYEDIAEHRVTYVMNNLSHIHDHMTLMITYNSPYTSDYLYDTVQLNVTIKPRIKTKCEPDYVMGVVDIIAIEPCKEASKNYLEGNFQVFPNETVPIPLEALDASELASLSSSVPVYSVLKEATFAHLLTTDDDSDVPRILTPLDTFTHDDVASGHVLMTVSGVNMNNCSSIDDEILLRLWVEDGSVQPAVFSFHFTISPLDTSAVKYIPTQSSTVTSISSSWETSTFEYVNMSVAMTTNFSLLATDVAMTTLITTPLPAVRVADVEKVEKADDFTLMWLIPVIIVLMVLIIAALVSIYVLKNRKKAPVYVRGEESATLKATSPPIEPPTCVNGGVDSQTVVKVTSSRADTSETPQHCPTAAVVVTALGKPPTPYSDEDFDDGFYGDGYMSNSMPPEGHLSAYAMQGLSVVRGGVAGSSPHGLTGVHPGHQNHTDYYSPSHPLMRDEEFSSESSGGEDVLPPRRTHSSASLPLRQGHLSALPLDANQYWI